MARNDPKPCAGCSAPIQFQNMDGRWFSMNIDGTRHDCPQKEALKAALRARGPRRYAPPPAEKRGYTPGDTGTYYGATSKPAEPEKAVGFNVEVDILLPFPQTLRYHDVLGVLATNAAVDSYTIIPSGGTPAFMVGSVDSLRITPTL